MSLREIAHLRIRIQKMNPYNWIVIATWFFWGCFLLFHLHNFWIYLPESGYDGTSHTQLIEHYLKIKGIPSDWGRYGASNPPLFYVVSAVILGLTKSMKLVQATSLLFYMLGMFCFKKVLEVISRDQVLNLALLSLFSFLPASFVYAYIVSNYTLGYELAIYAFAFVGWVAFQCQKKESVPFLRWMFYLGILLGLGMLTSLTNIATIQCCLIGVALLPRLNWVSKLKGGFLVTLTLLAVTYPYYQFRYNEMKCLFCTANRIQTNQPFYKVYPPQFYFQFPISAFKEPYASKYLTGGLGILLHQTLYSDYFNYIVGPSYRSDTNLTAGKIFTGLHYIDDERILLFRVLNYLGLGLSSFFFTVLLLSFKKIFGFSRGRSKEGALDLFLLTVCALYFVQFLAYIHRYPNYVNIHAGYLYPALGAFLLLTARALQNRRIVGFFSVLTFAYSAVSAYTFWLR